MSAVPGPTASDDALHLAAEAGLPDFTAYNDLAVEKVGGCILFATDDWFARAENMLKSSPPEWKEGVFTEFGKWMDGWETRRKRIPGHDWCIIQLGEPGVIHGFELNTAYFTGNYAPRMSIQGACLDKVYRPRQGKIGKAATRDEFAEIAELKSEDWNTIVPMSKLKPGYEATCRNFFPITVSERITHLRLNIYPDGGIARFHVYGQAKPNWSKIPLTRLIDLLAVENGGVCLGFSNAHFGHGRNLIGLGRAPNMGDGWETARRLDRPAVLHADEKGVLQVPGFEWSMYRLGYSGVITKIEIDTNHFKGNFPNSCRIEACCIRENEEKEVIKKFDSEPWKELLPRQKLSGHTRHYYTAEDMKKCGVITHVRICIAPDGGVSRMRLWGYRKEIVNAKL